VPDVLTSGDHEEVARWRRAQSIARTARRRPDMLERAELTPEEQRIAEEALAHAGAPVADARLFRVIMPVDDMDRGVAFYRAILAQDGVLVAPNRHYFHCGATILALVKPGEHDSATFRPNIEHAYFSVRDLKAAYERARTAECSWLEDRIRRRPWGEKSFYLRDPFGNPLCFVDEKTAFTGRG
jgi:catechol 2,3-dioxygenase-like lactoylglutathione lyase family enzyme